MTRAAHICLLLLLLLPSARGQRSLLVLAREEHRQTLQPWVEWKEQNGYRVTQLYPTEHHRDSVRNYLIRHCEAVGERPEYMMIVGAHTHFPAFLSSHQPMGIDFALTDLPYCDLDNDLRPDAMLGRMPARDTAELRLMLDKSMRYEQRRLADTTHLGRALLMAGYECLDPAPSLTNGQVHALALAFAAAGMDTTCFLNPALDSLPPEWEEARRDSVLLQLARGAGHIVYTGHGKQNRWLHPTITAQRVLDLPATDRIGFLVSNCCRSCEFYGNSLGEAFLQNPHAGAACVIGSANETLWQEDYTWALAAYQAYFAGQAATAGQMLRAGNRAVEESGSQFADYYWEMYLILGDPTFEPLIGIPAPDPLAIANPLPPNPSTLQVYPNPAHDHISVNAPYRLIDLQGRPVGTDLARLPNGIYFVQTPIGTQRLIVQHP